MPRIATLLLLLLASAAAVSAGGCLDASTRKKVSENGILALIAPPSPAEAARMMADPFDADKRYKGVTWISNAPWGGADVYMRVYREMVANENEDAGVRAVAARALAFHGTPEDALLLVPLLKHDDMRVRQTTTRALQRLHNPAVIPNLVPLVDDAHELDHDVRQAAASALGQYADPRVLAALIGALNDDDLAVSRTARESLRTLTGTDAGDEPKRWQDWAAATTAPFSGQSKYLYPNFHRGQYFWEYIPFVPGPPNEASSTPVGFRPPGT
ncbi:MAG: HEAT repeat domain-containing protein [Phycisphaerales bacterium]|nr:HEAT repeat domain-containing protein [Phycisphaerales bacterium]